jgi:flagellar motility protein MotE (MotC chaperone)
MKFLIMIFITISSLISLETSDKLFKCTEIFKARKSELLVELERIDEQKQALSSLKIATEELLRKKQVKVSQDEEKVQKKLDEITSKETNIKEMLEKNEAVLKKIREIKMDKIAQTFAKMKAASAAGVLSEMDVKEASEILSSLKPKTVGKILSKMEAKKASQLTVILAK